MSINTPIVALNELTPLQLQPYIEEVAKENGLNADHFLIVAECESGLNPTIQSGYKNSDGSQERSFGLWQINLDAHPEITLQEADDPVWSTEWTAKQWLLGREYQWACWKQHYGPNRVYIDM